MVASISHEYIGGLLPILASRDQFVRDVRTAVASGSGFAAGKLGGSERVLLRYPLIAPAATAPASRRALEMHLREHALHQAGIFPAVPAFCREFAGFLAESAQRLDYLGVFLEQADADDELALLRQYELCPRWIHYRDQEPDGSTPAAPARCYLDSFAHKRLLLLSPFAGFLAERGEQTIFEAVWAKTGRSWFAPASVEGLEYPYGFDPKTWSRFPTAIALIDDILERVAARSFDVALISAGGISIPLAVGIKQMGKVAISLGGHLQVLFGVLGRRWRARPEFRRAYVNDAWVDVPERYRPAGVERHASGDYW